MSDQYSTPDIYDIDAFSNRCIGQTTKQQRCSLKAKCTRAAAPNDLASMEALHGQIMNADVDDATLSYWLQRFATSQLCDKFHQSQAARMIEAWATQISRKERATSRAPKSVCPDVEEEYEDLGERDIRARLSPCADICEDARSHGVHTPPWDEDDVPEPVYSMKPTYNYRIPVSAPAADPVSPHVKREHPSTPRTAPPRSQQWDSPGRQTAKTDAQMRILQQSMDRERAARKDAEARADEMERLLDGLQAQFDRVMEMRATGRF